MNSLKHVVCAISGGVDSAVMAYLLKRQGYRLTGCFMKNWNRDEELFKNCNSDTDQSDAEYVCKKLDIPFFTLDFSKNYWNLVFSQFLNEYERGMTPNPDILCNKHIKFPLILNHCRQRFGEDFHFLATGHYARLKFDPTNKKYRLLKSLDELKDQSFFLAQLDPALFEHILFPVGDLHKSQVRKIAHEAGLDRVFNKKSSTGICFIGRRKFVDFIDEYLPPRKGHIVDLEDGQTLGEHTGLHHFTIGQRIASIDQRLNVKKIAYYVAKKDHEKNIMYIVAGTNHSALYFDEFEVEKPHWLCDNKELNSPDGEYILDEKYDFKFQNKHHQSPIVYLKRVASETATSDAVRYFVKTAHHFRAIASGQFAVFYHKEECIGSAKIINVPKSLYDLGYKDEITINSDRLLIKNYVSNKLKFY